jgi:Ulp1 family protease
VDLHLLNRLECGSHSGPVPGVPESRVLTVVAAGRSRRYQFLPEDLSALGPAPRRLNDLCMNGLAALLQAVLSESGDVGHKASGCAIFSSYDLVTIQDRGSKHTQASERLWARAAPLTYWAKVVWIIPINRKDPCGHWVLAVVLHRSSRLLLFDSLNDSSSWQDEIPVSLCSLQ